VTAYTARRPCWVLSLPGDSERVAHLATRAEAAGEARAYAANHDARAPRFRRLTGPCAAVTCDGCGETLGDDDGPVHFGSLEAGVQAADFAGWTSNSTCTRLHCDECSARDPLSVSPLSAYRFPAVIDVPLPGLEEIA
jgi:hypothetical protein